MAGVDPEKLKRAVDSQVETEDGEVFRLGECIGAGGQGAVYSTQRHNILVKLSPIGKDGSGEVERKYSRYKSLRCRRDFPKYLARPIAEIKPVKKEKGIVHGYAMELMEDMVPLSDLFRKKREKATEYIKRMGGIRRMYTILRKVAEILDGIHSIGYVYGDLNPNNVFVSKDVGYSEVQLIDCDNLMIAADYDCRISFPGYGAPELVKEAVSACNSLTDVWSYAVLAFFVLRQQFPFRGAMVADAKNTTELEQMEEKARNAELSFIDEEGGGNASRSALPRDDMESPEMRRLFAETFGRGKEPFYRPTLREWIDVLRNDEYRFLKCADSGCGQTFLYIAKAAEVKCPFCNGQIVEPYAVCGKGIRFAPLRDSDSSLFCPFDAKIVIADVPAEIAIPASEHGMLRLKVSLDSERKTVCFEQLGDKTVVAKLSINCMTDSGKKMNLGPGTKTRIPAKNEKKYFLQFPEYTFRDGEGEEKCARGVITFKCRGFDE